MKKSTSKDRRQHKRYYAKNRLFAMVRSDNHKLERIKGLSKGEIAFAVIRSKPAKMGEIKEISQSGLSFHYIQNESELNGFNEMDILFADENFHLCRIPFKTVADTKIEKEDPLAALAMSRLTVKFDRLSPKQMHQLDHLIENYTTGEVPKELKKPASANKRIGSN